MINHKIMGAIAIGATIVAVPAAVVGGNIGMSSLNPYYKYYRTPITGDNSGFISAYLSAHYLGAEAIVAPGFTHKAPIEALYNSPKDAEMMKDTGFLLLDEAIDYEINPAAEPWGTPFYGTDGKPVLSNAITNTASITFRADLGSIQTALAMCQFLNDYESTFGPDLTFGMYGGAGFSSVVCFMGGMQEGINWFNENVADGTKVNATTGKPYKKITIIEPNAYVDAPDKDGNMQCRNYGGGFGPGDGDSIINTYLQQPDLDAFMPIAGPQVWTAQKKIMELNKKTVLIGVDSPCEDDALNQPLKFTTPDGKPVGNGKYVQFSSEKNLAKATNNILTIMNNGNRVPAELMSSNDYENFHDASGLGGIGTISVGDATNGCVKVSLAGEKYLNAAVDASGKTDPSLDPKYSDKNNMYYQYQKYTNPRDTGKAPYDDLKQEFINVLKPGTYSMDGHSAPVEPINLSPNNVPFIQKDVQSDDNKIKLVLSDPTSILFDGSFAESSYRGMVEFYKSLGITIPSRKVGK